MLDRLIQVIEVKKKKKKLFSIIFLIGQVKILIVGPTICGAHQSEGPEWISIFLNFYSSFGIFFVSKFWHGFGSYKIQTAPATKYQCH